MNEMLIPRKGNYKKLLSYQKTEVIFEMTYYFCHHFLQRGDRTIDQMVQAARSGKQNIVEGCAASATSNKTEIRLVSVAKASLQELLEDYEDYLDVAKEVAAGEFQGDVNYFMKKGANFPFNLNGMICVPMYVNVCNAIMANFFDFLKTKDVNIFACEDCGDESGSYKICFEDFDGPPAKAKVLFEAYAEEFGLYRHFLNVFFDETEPIEKAPVLLGTKITTISHTPSKGAAGKVQQGILKDQNDILIEIGDIIAYPRGGDHNFYCLNYGKVVANTNKMVIMEDDQKARCDKVMVIKTNNPNKKLPWDN